MPENLNPLTNLPEEKGPRIISSEIKRQSAISPMRELLKPVDISKGIQESAPSRERQLLSNEDFTADPDYGKLMGKYNQNFNLEKNLYLKELDEEQNVFESAGAGALKLVGKTASGIGFGLLGTAWGATKALFTLDADQLVEDNIFTELEEDVRTGLDKALPIYSDNPNYHSLGLMDKLLTEPGKLFGDEVGDAVAFTASAIGQEILLSAATAATLGSAAPAQAAASARLAKRGYDIFKNLAKGKKALQVLDATADIAKYKNTLANFAGMTAGLAVSTHYETGLEARGTKDAMLQSFTEDYMAEYGVAPSEVDLAQAEELADQAMWATYGLNSAILSASYLIQFSSVFQKGYKGYKAAQKAASELVYEGTEYATKKSQMNVWNKAIKNSYLVAKNPITESTEEFLQGVANEGALEYFGRQYNPEVNKENLDFFSIYGKAAVDYFNSTEGGNSMGIGAIVGLLGLPVGKSRGGWSGGAIGELLENKRVNKQAEELVNSLNSKDFKTALKENFKNSVTFSSLSADMKATSNTNDTFNFKNLEHDSMFSYMYNRVKLGLKEDVLNDINAWENKSLEEFNQEFGSELTEPFTEEQRKTTIKKAKEFVESVEKNTKAAESIVEYNVRKAPKKDKAEIEAVGEKVKPYLIHAASTLENIDVREEELTERLMSISNFNETTIKEIAKESKHYNALNRLSQLSKKKELSNEESKEQSSLLKEVKINSKKFKELSERSEEVNLYDLREISEDFKNFEEGVNQEAFMKVASDRIENYAKENPTKGTINKAEMYEIVEDIAKLKNRRESFSKFYDFLATKEGAETMSNMIDVAENNVAESLEKGFVDKATEAAATATDATGKAYAEKKAAEAPGTSAASKVATVQDEKFQKQSQEAPKVDTTNAGTIRSTALARYKGNPELLEKEAKEFVAKYDPSGSKGYDRIHENPEVFARTLMNVASMGGDLQFVKDFFAKIEEESSKKAAVNNHTTKTHEGPSPEVVDTTETDFNNEDSASDFSFDKNKTVINYWQYAMQFSKDLGKWMFNRTDGKLIPSNPFLSTKNKVNHELINSGKLKVGTKLKFFVDTSEDVSDLSSEADFRNKFKIIVKDEAGNVLGLVPSGSNSPSVIAFRENVYNNLLTTKALDKQFNYVNTNQVIDTGYTSTVEHVDAGRVNYAPTLRQSLTEVLGTDFKLGVGRVVEGNIVLDTPGVTNAQRRNDIRPGVVYALVPNAGGRYTPFPVITRNLTESEQVQLEDGINKAITENETPLKKAEALFDLKMELDFAFIPSIVNITQSEGSTNITFLTSEAADETTTLSQQEFIDFLKTKKAQVDVNLINTSDYNQTIDSGDNPRISTNIVKGAPIHSATFSITEVVKEEENPLKDSATQNTPIKRKSLADTFGFNSEVDTELELTLEEKVEDIERRSASVTTTTDKKPRPAGPRKPTRTKLADSGKSEGTWNKDKSLAWLKKNLPNVPVHVLEDLSTIHNTGGRTAWGLFKDASIYIANNAGKGTAYHEAFHAVFWLSLNDTQRFNLLKDAQIETGLTDDVALEEYLAEKFEDFMLSNVVDTSLSTRIKNWFKRLKATIKSIFSNQIKMDELFRNINNGVYKNTKVTGKYADLVRTKMAGYTVNERVEMGEMLADMFRDEISILENSNQLFTPEELINKFEYTPRIINEQGEEVDGNTLKGPAAIMAKIYHEQLYYNHDDLYQIAVDYKHDWNKIEQSDAYKSAVGTFKGYKTLSKEELEYRLQMYDVLMDEFEDLGYPKADSTLFKDAIKNLRNYGINIQFLKKKIKEDTNLEAQSKDTISEEKLQEEQEANTQYEKESWMYSKAEVSGKDTISQFVRSELSQLDEVVLKGTEYKTVGNIVGYPKKLNFGRVFNSLKSDLTNTYDLPTMLKVLESKLDSKPYYSQVISLIETNQRFRSGFVHALATARVDYISLVEQPNGVGFNVVGSNRNTPELTIRREWSSNLEALRRRGELSTAKLQVVKKTAEFVSKNLSEGKGLTMNDAVLVARNIYSPIGIELTPEEILRDLATINTNLSKGINILLTQIEKGNNPFSMNESGETKYLTPLLDLAKETRNDLYESSFLNVEGKQVFTNQTPNFLHKHANKLTGENSTATITNLQKDVFYKDNLWLNELKKGDNKNNFKVFMIDGLSFLNKEKKKYTKLTPKERMLTDLLLFRNSSGTKAKYTFPILADAPQLPIVEFLKYTKEEVINHLINVAQQEYNRNTIIKKEQQEYEEGKIRKEDLILNYHIDKNGNLLEPKFHYITTMDNFDPSSNPQKAREAVEKFIVTELEAAKANIKRFSINRSAVDPMIQSAEEFDMLVEDYVSNQILANIQMLQLFAGDSAFYKSQADLSKRNKQATNPGNVLDLTSIGETYNTMYFKDIELPSAFLASYEEILKDVDPKVRKGILASYGANDSDTKVSLTDAQAVISLERYKAIKTAAGEWTPEHDVAYPKIKEGTATSLEMSLFLQPLKPFYYGMTTNHLFNGKIVPVQNKNSEFVIFPQMLNMPYFKGKTKAKANLEKMLNLFDSTEFNLDSIQFDTAVKVGGSGITNFADLDLKDTKSIKANTHTLNNKDYNIQLSVPEHHINSEILLGTQIRKLVIANIDATSTDKNYTLNGEQLTGVELISKYQEAIVANVEEESRKLAEIFKDNKELSELLKEQMMESGMSQKYIDALELDMEGNFKYPLFLPNVTKKNESILSALFRNRVTRQKIKGGSFVQVSDFVFGEGLEVKFKEVEFNGEKKLIVEHMEALLPWWAKEYFPMDENGIVDITKIDPELLNLVGLRIPTEAKYSMPTIKVVGFTPQTAGGVAVLPADITRRMGADFDIDKLYIMMPEFDITTDESGFRKAMQNELGISNEVYDYVKKTPLKTLVQNAEGGISGQAKTYLEHRQFIDANKHKFQTIKKVPSGLETTQQRNNLLLDIMNSVLKNPLHQVENVTPGSFEVLMNLKKVISEQLNLPKDDLNMALPSSQVELFARNMSGSSMIGIYANHTAHHAITQYTNIEFSKPMSFVMNNSKGVSFKHEAKSLHLQKDVNGKLISSSLAEFLAAAVDNAKDPVLSSLNINEETADVVALLVRTGIPLEEAMYFINLPSIRYLVTTMLNGNSFEIAEQLTKEYMESTFKGATASYKNINELDLRHTKTTVLNYSNYSNLNAGEKDEFKQQLYNGLVAFVTLRSQAKDLATLLAASRADAKGSQGINSNQTLIDKIEKVKLSDTFVPGTVSELFDGNAYPMVRAFTNEGVKKANQTLNKFFPFNKGAYLASKVEIAGIKRKDLTEEEQDAIDLQGLTFIASQFEFFNMEREEAQSLILNFPTEFRETLKSNPELIDNQFIEVLKFEDKADNGTNLNRIITNNASALDELQKEKIELGFMELMEKNQDFANKLLKYSFAVNGFSFSPTSFMNFMPLEAFDNLIDSKGVSLTDYFKNNASSFNAPDFVDKFIQNNLSIFPNIVATKQVEELDAEEIYTTYGKSATMGDVVSFVVSKGSLPRFINVTKKDKTNTFYESMANEDYSVYTLLPVSSKRGYYLPYTQESGVTSAYDESALDQMTMFGANGGYGKVADIKYTGASQLEELSKESGISYLPTREELDKLDKPTEEKVSLEEAKATAEELNEENNLDNSEISSTFVSGKQLSLFEEVKEEFVEANYLTSEEVKGLWEKHKETFLKNGVDVAAYNEMIKEFGAKYILDYIKKCK